MCKKGLRKAEVTTTWTILLLFPLQCHCDFLKIRSMFNGCLCYYDILISVSAINSEWVKSMKIFPVTYKVLQRKLSWCPDDNVNKTNQQKCFKGSYQIMVFDAVIINQSLDFIHEQDCCTCCQWKKSSANILKKNLPKTSSYINFAKKIL